LLHTDYRLCAPPWTTIADWQKYASYLMAGANVMMGNVGGGIAAYSMKREPDPRVWLTSASDESTFWSVWILGDRDESSMIHEDDDLVLFAYNTLPDIGARTAKPNVAGSDIQGWKLPYWAAGLASHPFQRLGADEIGRAHV